MHTDWSHNEAIAGSVRCASSSLPVRLRGAALVAACSAVLATAASLSPRAGGYGTHQELGLPACSFLARTGYPCPSCGLTTSVSAAVHGRFVYAFESQPFGLVLVVSVLIFAAVGMFEMLFGRGLLNRLRPRPWWAVGAFVGMLLGWGWKLAAGVADGTYPLH
ncbi:MAG: DUF2752 domain-containing protein [Phycisphaerae bacterium]